MKSLMKDGLSRLRALGLLGGGAMMLSCAQGSALDAVDREPVGASQGDGCEGEGCQDVPEVALDASEPSSTAPLADVGWGAADSELESDVLEEQVDTPEILEDVSVAENDASESTTCDEGGPGCFGAPCEGPEDCYSGQCVPHLGDQVCSKTCEDDCPQGFDCELVNSPTSDPTYLCVSRFGTLCQPCLSNADCVNELGADVCVDYGDEGAFCGAPCEVDVDCPADYGCSEVTTLRGGEVRQCVALARRRPSRLV